MAGWRLICLGTGSLLSPTHRAFPATLLDASGTSYLFDCGDGTVSLLRLVGGSQVDVVAVTSVSTQEIAGLLTLAEVQRRSKRKALRVCGPPGLKHALEELSILLSSMTVTQLFDIEEPAPGQAVYDDGGKYLEPVQVDVGNASVGYGYLIYEYPLPGRVDAAKARCLGIRGADFAQLQAGQTVHGVRPDDVIGPARRGRRVVVTGRGRSTESLAKSLEGSDVAVFAAPFMDERLEVAEDKYYLTGWEAAELASRARVRMVLLQQLGPYAPVPYQVAEARQFHERLLAPNDGDVVSIPLPEDGIPGLERGNRRQTERLRRPGQAGQRRGS